jgi:hypothetical protein
MVTAVAPTAATPGRDGAAREATKVVPMPGSSRRCQCLGSGASVQAPRFRRLGSGASAGDRQADADPRGVSTGERGPVTDGSKTASVPPSASSPPRPPGILASKSAFLDRKLSGLLPPTHSAGHAVHFRSILRSIFARF